MSINLDTLSAKELQSLITQAKKRRTTLAKRKPIAAVRKKVQALIKAEGYTVAELFGTGGSAPRFFGSRACATSGSTRSRRSSWRTRRSFIGLISTQRPFSLSMSFVGNDAPLRSSISSLRTVLSSSGRCMSSPEV